MPKALDLTGQRFGSLVAIRVATKEETNNSKKRHWLCQCDCGNTTIVLTSYLTTGHTKSCGCLRAQTMSETMSNNLIGQKFNKLTVLEKTNSRGRDGCIIWKCQCECGNITYTNTNSLKRGDTQSCGCLRSKGERLINSILFENHIPFYTQYHFKDLKDKKYLYFDFAIFDENNKLKCLVEYQGIQHYIPDALHGAWKNTPQEHDRMKREYCEKNNILLVEIPYTDLNLINWEYLKNKLGL